jgi:hypothetical protein
MTKVVYISKSTIERKRGPLRIAHLPGSLSRSLTACMALSQSTMRLTQPN